MFAEYINNVKKIGFINIFTKLFNLLKIVLIGNLLGLSYESERFFLVCGLLFPVYYIIESVFQAYLIPLYRSVDYKFVCFITTKYIKKMFVFSVIFASFVCFLDIFEYKEKIYVFFLTILLLNSALYKIILECKLEFVKNSLIDLICSIFFVIIFIFAIKDLLLIIVIIEFIRSFIKFCYIFKDISFKKKYSFVFKENYKDILYISAGAFFSNIKGSIDTYFVSFFEFGAAVLNIGTSLPSALIQYINSILSGISLGFFSDKWFDDFERRKQVYNYFFIPLILICSFLFVFSENILQTIFFLKKQQFSDNFYISNILSAYSILIPFFYLKIIMIRFLNSRKKNLFLMKNSLFSFFIYLFLLFIVFSKNITGVAFSRIGADIVFGFSVMLFTEDKKAIYWYLKKVLQISVVFITLYLLFKRKGVF
ncbi:MAG: hypothetical protein M0R46_05050 [Candidatus Muirbacterium halophilum]|nr:hypothetical protein [Candidatus Muirbacterium halophilum]